ncbi:peptidase S8 [Gramella sp. AN32]|nr:peptidase S8 [Gramella sp. AN32]
MLLTVSCEKEESFEMDTTSENAVSENQDFNFVPNEVLIKFKAGEGKAQSKALSIIQGAVIENITTQAMESRGMAKGEFLLVSSKLKTLDAIKLLQNLAEVEYAEPNYIYRHDATSNDTFYLDGSLWGMYGDASSPANQYGSQAAEAWAAGKTGSSNVYIGIIDEGYMFDHVDLAANAGTNPGEIAGNGVDDDGNGYIDDVYGWDFDGNDNSIFDGVDDDHGTHVAGTIGASGGNGTGVAGVVWDVKLLSGKFLGRRGGSLANAIKAVDYFTDLKQRHGINIVATSNSWGGGGFSQGLQDAIERANQAGILFIAAAGNDSNNNDASASYPGSYTNDNIISVASITKTGGLSSFSNFGATSVDIGAPGSAIYSTVPTRSKGQVVSAYASYSGTSMATPHVSGAAALYASINPGATAAQIKNAILSSAVPTSSLSGKVLTNGRLDVGGF